MFTGIIQRKGIITKRQKLSGEPLKLTIAVDEPAFVAAQRIGDSICIDGVCLSIVDINAHECSFSFQAIEQTCKVTTLGSLAQNSSVHVEPSLQVHDKIDGHYVSGHVDQASSILAIKEHADGSRTLFIQNQTPELIRLRGSIAINGVSLTVSDVAQEYFCVCLIPITLEKTNLAALKVGDAVNLEYDLFLKSAHRTITSAADLIGQPIISATHAMRAALQLAELGKKTTPPNPWVGCVLVKDGMIIGAGYHARAGEAHAEIEALRSLKNPADARGATLYCTLEPCCHTGRTGPCTQAIIDAGIAQVIIGIQDPDVRVAAKGIEQLRAHGIQVQVGTLADEITESLKPYLYHRTSGKPFVIAKAGMSIDGKLAAQDGSSQWITDEHARAEAHELRSRCQAVLVGSGTVMKDNPRLTVRSTDYQGHQPMRVVLDTYGTVCNPELALFDQTEAKTIIFTSSECAAQAQEVWKQHGIDFYIVPSHGDLLDINAVYEQLGKLSVISLLVEGGSAILSHLIKADAYNELHLYVGDVIIGNNGIPLFDSQMGTSMADVKKLRKRGAQGQSIVYERMS